MGWMDSDRSLARANSLQIVFAGVEVLPPARVLKDLGVRWEALSHCVWPGHVVGRHSGREAGEGTEPISWRTGWLFKTKPSTNHMMDHPRRSCVPHPQILFFVPLLTEADLSPQLCWTASRTIPYSPSLQTSPCTYSGPPPHRE